jgi:FkbM family methyltransferase
MTFSLFPRLRELHLPMPRGVLQVGASYGQEMKEFLDNGIQAGVFIEPLPEPYQFLANTCRTLPNFVAVNTVCAEASGKQVSFHVASNGGMSSSLLPPVNHLKVNPQVQFPGTVQLVTSTVDEVMALVRSQGHAAVADTLDLMYLDCQGGEFQVFRGASRTLPQFKYIYTEVMRNEMYAGQVPFLNYCHFFDSIGFTLNDVYFAHPEQTGNALFIRKDLVAVS